MKVLYIFQYFVTPSEPGFTRSYWISQELIRRGHRVTVITSTNQAHPEAVREVIDGVDVIYVKNDYSNYMSAPRRVFAFLNFVRLALREARKLADVDLVYATSSPLTVGYIAMRLKACRGWKYVFEVRDLWPEFPIEVGAVKNPLAIKYLRDLERRIYEKSEFVVALSPGTQEGVISAGMPREKTAMIPNMSKPDLFYPRPVNVDVVREFNLDLNKFNVVYFGAMGRSSGLEYIINAAKTLKERGNDDVAFVLLGDGSTYPRLMRLAEEYGLDNVRFLGNHKMDLVSEIVNCCDVSITTFLNLPVLKNNSPNKLFDSLSAGKPIIVNSAGWTKDLVEKEDCGCFVDPDRPEDLAEKLLEIKYDRELLDRWGKNARRLSVEVFDKNLLCAQVADILERVV